MMPFCHSAIPPFCHSADHSQGFVPHGKRLPRSRQRGKMEVLLLKRHLALPSQTNFKLDGAKESGRNDLPGAAKVSGRKHSDFQIGDGFREGRKNGRRQFRFLRTCQVAVCSLGLPRGRCRLWLQASATNERVPRQHGQGGSRPSSIRAE